MDSNYSLSDIAAATGGNGRNDGAFGGDWGAWIILFLLFGMFGRGGWGMGAGGGGSEFQGYATRADINEGFALNSLQTGIQSLQQGICDSTYAITGKIADCCCQTQRSVDGVNFNLAKGFCDINNVIGMNTRDILENQNSNTRAILDFLTNDKIATLTAENQSLRLNASQANQNAVLMAAMDANKAEILRRTGAECPTAAYIVQPPTPVHFSNGCGCGCNNGGFAYGYGNT